MRHTAIFPFVVLLSLPAFSQQPMAPNSFATGAVPSAIGTFTNNRFHHTLTGTEFSLPAGWSAMYQGHSSGGGEQIGFALNSDAGEPLIRAFVWMKPESRPADQISSQLRSAVEFKAGQRQPMMANYQMLRKTIEPRAVAGWQALSVQAQYVEGSTTMIEYHTWIITGRTSVYLSARMRQTDFDSLKAKVDEILDTFSIP
jgi:hypothetical protein